MPIIWSPAMATVSDTAVPPGVADPGAPAEPPSLEAGADLAVAAWRPGPDAESKSDRYLARRLAAATADFKGVALTTF
ncbi:MAG: hypothetical protein EBZ74_07475, partial [Planctomycetia bacterium]|nr:hypothetical protein [Planctomycetia bacterium]